VPKAPVDRSGGEADFTATFGAKTLRSLIDRGGLGLRQARPPALVPRQHDAAARDDDDPVSACLTVTSTAEKQALATTINKIADSGRCACCFTSA
jgi:hypothetical protein